MRNSRGDIGEPWGVPTSTGALVPGAPWKTRVQDRSERKEVTQSTMYEGMFFARSKALSFTALTLSKPALMSRKRVETAHRGRWRVRTSWIRVAHASEVLNPTQTHAFFFFSVFFFFIMRSLFLGTRSFVQR